jgi:hypothetical protein
VETVKEPISPHFPGRVKFSHDPATNVASSEKFAHSSQTSKAVTSRTPAITDYYDLGIKFALL